MKWLYTEPLASDLPIREFQVDNALILPADYVACVRENGGGKPERCICTTADGKEHIVGYLLSFAPGSSVDIRDYNHDTSRYVAIAIDPFGNAWCIERQTGHIVFRNHETNAVVDAADSFTAFLEKLMLPLSGLVFYGLPCRVCRRSSAHRSARHGTAAAALQREKRARRLPLTGSAGLFRTQSSLSSSSSP